MQSFKDIDALTEWTGRQLGLSDWVTIDQERIERFADATDDHQWIHVDIERAERESPFGSPVAHGFLTLSLLPRLIGEILHVEGVTTRINYGLDKVRFIQPVPSGAQVRARATLAGVEPRGEGRYLIRNTVTIEIDNHDKPACLAESLSLFIL